MGKLVVGAFLSVDGVMQAPGGPNEDPSDGFTAGGWSAGYWDETMFGIITESMSRTDALLLGRKTYEIFAAHWPQVGDEDPIAAQLNSMPKYVASRTLDRLDWNNAHLIEGDVADGVRELKGQPYGEIQTQGSANLIQTLLRQDLVDEFRLWYFPVVLGGGKRLFGDGAVPSGLQLVDSTTSSTGVTINTYERAGEIKFGSFELE